MSSIARATKLVRSGTVRRAQVIREGNASAGKALATPTAKLDTISLSLSLVP